MGEETRAGRSALWVGAAVAAAALLLLAWPRLRPQPEPIRVGILHSLTGTMAVSERPVVDGCLLAIEQINAAGGVLGRRVEAVVRDGASDPETFAREAARLIEEDRVVAIFGCWTSASRKETLAKVEALGGVLFYPVQYEGLELSPRAVYLGAAPNQQIIPAVRWALERFGRRVMLVGSDYVFPRVANAIIRDQVAANGGEVAAERYLPLGSRRVADLVEEIRTLRPDAILSTINGDTNEAFFAALRAAGVSAGTVPTISFSIGEPEVAAIGPGLLAGDFVAWNYFQSLDSPENEAFVSAYRARFGEDRLLSDPIEAGFIAVHLWAAAIDTAGEATADAALRGIGGRHLAAPQGPVAIDPRSRHAWKTARIGRIRSDGQIESVWSSDTPMRPLPYPAWRLRSEWDALLAELREGWGGRWSAEPAK